MTLNDETDVFYSQPSQRLTAMSTTMSFNNSMQYTNANNSFDFRLALAPPVQVHETTM